MLKSWLTSQSEHSHARGRLQKDERDIQNPQRIKTKENEQSVFVKEFNQAVIHSFGLRKEQAIGHLQFTGSWNTNKHWLDFLKALQKGSAIRIQPWFKGHSTLLENKRGATLNHNDRLHHHWLRRRLIGLGCRHSFNVTALYDYFEALADLWHTSRSSVYQPHTDQ